MATRAISLFAHLTPLVVALGLLAATWDAGEPSAATSVTVTPRVVQRTASPIDYIEARGRDIAVGVTPLADNVLELYRGQRRVGRWSAPCADPGIGSVGLGGGGIGYVCAEYTNVSESSTLELRVPGRARRVLARVPYADYESLAVVGDGRRLAFNKQHELYLYDGSKARRLVTGAAGLVYALEGERVAYTNANDEIVVSTLAGSQRWTLGDLLDVDGGMVLAQGRAVTLGLLDELTVYNAASGRRLGRWQLRGRPDISSESLTVYGRFAAYLRGAAIHLVDLRTGRDTPLQIRYPGPRPGTGSLVPDPDVAFTPEGLWYTYNSAEEGPGWMTLIPNSTLEKIG